MSTATRLLGFGLCLLLMVTLLGCATAPTDGPSSQVETVYSPQPASGVEDVDAAKKDLAELLAGKRNPGIKYLGESGINNLAEEGALKELVRGRSGPVTFWYQQEELVFMAFSSIAVHEDRIEVSPRISFSFEDAMECPLVVEKTREKATIGHFAVGKTTSGASFRYYKVTFPGKMAFYFEKLTDAQRFADDLFVIQQDLKKKQDERRARFESKAAEYRVLAVKPPVSEEQRKLVVQANTSNEQKDYAGAIGLYLKAVDLDPVSYPGAYFNLALLSAQMKRYNAAIGYMKQYMQLVPDAPDARSAQDKIYEWELLMKK